MANQGLIKFHMGRAALCENIAGGRTHSLIYQTDGGRAEKIHIKDVA